MNRFIIENSEAHHVLNNIYGMFEDLINNPNTIPNDSLGMKEDLEIANALLATLEQLFSLRMSKGSPVPKTCGVEKSEMLQTYNRMKHWQQLLNNTYADRAQVPDQRLPKSVD